MAGAILRCPVGFRLRDPGPAVYAVDTGDDLLADQVPGYGDDGFALQYRSGEKGHGGFVDEGLEMKVEGRI